MKKTISSILSLTLAAGLLLSGCGSSVAEIAATPQETSSETSAEAKDTSADSAGIKQEESSGNAEEGEKTVTFGTSTLWETFNYLDTTSTPTDGVIEEFFDRLVVINTDGSFDPRLAKSWDIDGTDITFHLDENAKWHDGEPVTAEDIVYTFRLQSSPDVQWLRQSNVKYLEGTDDNGKETGEDSIGVTAVDEHTVKLQLKQPADETRIFSTILRDVFVLPSHLLKDIPDADIKDAPFWSSPVGSGPFIFNSQIDGERVEGDANPDYFLGRPNFDHIVIRFMDASTLAAALLNGEVDITSDVSISDLDTLKANPDITVESKKSFQYQDLCLNLKDDAFSDKNVRIAFDKAINKQAIIDNLYKGFGEPAKTILSSSHPYFNQSVLGNAYDPDAAKKLLEDAGFDFTRTYELTVPKGNQARERSAILIQQDLKAVGVDVSIVTYDFATALQNMRDNKYDLLLMGSAGRVDPEDGGVSYFSHTEDPKFKELWDKQASGTSFEERKSYLDEYQQYFVEEVPIVVLYFPDRFVFFRNRLSNVPFTDKTDFYINKKSWEWEVK